MRSFRQTIRQLYQALCRVPVFCLAKHSSRNHPSGSRRLRRSRRIHLEPLEPRLALAAQVQFDLELTNFDGSPLTSLAPGQEFLLRVTTEDVRPAPFGVFAAYLDITWDNALAVAAGPVRYTSPFTNGRSNDSIGPGLLDEVGAFASGSVLGGGPFKVFEVPLRAISLGSLVFSSDPAEVIPQHNVLVYNGNSGGIPPSDVIHDSVSIDIAGASALVAVGDIFDVNEDSQNVLLDPLANDQNGSAGGNSLTIAAVGQPSSAGAVTISADRKTLRYTPAANFSGTETFHYTVTNQQGESRTAAISVQVAEVDDDPPVARDDAVSLLAGQTTALQLLANDIIPLKSFLSVQIIAVSPGSRGGTAIIHSEKLVLYTPLSDFSGTETFTYTIADLTLPGVSSTATVTVFVSTQAAVPDAITVPEGNGPTVLDVLANDPINPHTGDSAPITSVTQPSEGGTISIAPDGGSLIYNAFPGFVGAVTFSYTVRLSGDVFVEAQAVLNVVAAPDQAPGLSLDGDTLRINGTGVRDNLVVSLHRNQLQVAGTLGGSRIWQRFPLSSVSQIIAHLHAGNDAITVRSNVRIPVTVHAGAGNDNLTAGGGSAVLLGNDGNDRLKGGRASDLLIGGDGQDRLTSRGKTDLLIDGSTTYDNDPAALAAIRSEWCSSSSPAARAANLQAGSGVFLASLGVSFQKNSTLLDDGDVDTLLTSADWTWMFADGANNAKPHGRDSGRGN